MKYLIALSAVLFAIAILLFAGCEGRTVVHETETKNVVVTVCTCVDGVFTDCEHPDCEGEVIRECRCNGTIIDCDSPCETQIVCPDGETPFESADGTQVGCVDTGEGEGEGDGYTDLPAGVYVALSSSTPASQTVPAGADSVEILEAVIETVGPSHDGENISSVTVSLGGVFAVSDVESVSLFLDDARVSDASPLDPETREVTLPWNHFVESREKLVSVVVDFSAGQFAGDMVHAEIVSVEADGDVFGAFPIRGNTMTLSSTAAHTLEISNGDAVTDPHVGETAVVARFRVRSPTSDGFLSAIGFTVVTPTIQGVYFLTEGAEEIGSCLRTVGSDRIACRPDTFFVLQADVERDLELEVFVPGTAGDTVRVAVAEKADVVGVDSEFGFQYAVDISGYDDVGDACVDAQSDCSFSTIQP